MKSYRLAEEVVEPTIQRVGKKIVLGAPLGAGKPNHILNAFYRRAKQQSDIELTILTALTLQRPAGNSLLEKRFLEPMAERVFEDYPDLDYELDRVAGRLPDNIRVIEFYFPPGKFLNHPTAQRDYISTNYTHVARDIIARGINVLASQVCQRTIDGRVEFSLSCNPDVAVDVMRYFAARDPEAAEVHPVVYLAQVNQNLPFMFGDAEVAPEQFDLVVDNREQDYKPFGPPKMSVGDAEHMIGLYISSLVRDGGELQIGIGALGDAVICGLLLRHQDNNTYRAALSELGVMTRFGDEIERIGALAPFDAGLFSASEMMVDGFIDLLNAGVIKRTVYDDPRLQALLNRGVIEEKVSLDQLDVLVQRGIVPAKLDADALAWLQRFGIVRSEIRFADGKLIHPEHGDITADLEIAETRAFLKAHGLGDYLRGGSFMHAGFFLGPTAFYQALREMPESRRKQIRMRSVLRINQLYGHEEIDRLHRLDGRFINTAMVATLLGAVASDGLADGRVVSGVGGQYNFVAMAHELPGGRSIINLRSTRMQGGKRVSNIVFNYGHTTIPRHLRDIVVTEYGIADLRGKTDEEVVKAMLNIADSQFQDELRKQAVAAGKLDPAYRIPELHRHNHPERYLPVLAKYKRHGHFQAFPLGCDFTDQELVIGKALKFLKAETATTGGRLAAIAKALTASVADWHQPYLERMDLTKPGTTEERLYRKLLVWGLTQTA